MLWATEEGLPHHCADSGAALKVGRLWLCFFLMSAMALEVRAGALSDRHAELPQLARKLSTWIALHTEYPEPPLPEIRFESQAGLQELCFPGFSHELLPRIRGAYDARSESIYLNNDLDPQNTLDASYLLHELVHHFQARSVGSKDRRLKSLMEAEALRLQLSWLEENGVLDGMEKLGVDERSLRIMETRPRHYPSLQGVTPPALTLACR